MWGFGAVGGLPCFLGSGLRGAMWADGPKGLLLQELWVWVESTLLCPSSLLRGVFHPGSREQGRR